MEITPNAQPKITPFLWFNGTAEEAMLFYTSIFKHSRIGSVQRYPANGTMPAGTVLSCTFELEGQKFMALNGSPAPSFTPAVSFFVHCEDQAEVDELWDKLSAGGREDRCGWLQDRYGLSWQIIPRQLAQLLHTPDPDKAGRVLQAMLQMTKIDIATLERAHAG
ncbi:VOC family protein [Rufibacter quisquiliarum]|uniref:Putative 3-demethylubiquinone-9 3-methyltransferase (Glyoxalase superfamily) n=1 Tax=Rufibacter quisquiliarum TaxID=1549639 RepID=A0A839GTP8_9BACT|nr:VOC family protein [Rufibacter quisquiliarum]MBA9078247.1 putative 3-demethylubiquinone-9 3-methyltransferase (glyoxalase superfamily) [Rufibacter quisquiliarum]